MIESRRPLRRAGPFRLAVRLAQERGGESVRWRKALAELLFVAWIGGVLFFYFLQFRELALSRFAGLGAL